MTQTAQTGINNFFRMESASGILCGVGFTMSLFIGSLAFESTRVDRIFDERLGILIGSLLSGIFGYLLLRYNLNKEAQE